MDEDLDKLVRRVDEDRWMASRFAPTEVRNRLVAIYAVNYEIARTAETVREPALGDMRLEWWRSGLEEITQGCQPRYHPALAALNRSLRMLTPAYALQEIARARANDLDAAPFADAAELEAYVDTTAGGLVRAALDACEPTLATCGYALSVEAGRAWGYLGLARAAPYWRAHGRSSAPRDGVGVDLLARAETAYEAAKRLAVDLPSELFPAFGYLATAPGYLRALRRGFVETPAFGRKATIVTASATGRI